MRKEKKYGKLTKLSITSSDCTHKGNDSKLNIGKIIYKYIKSLWCTDVQSIG